MTIALALLTGGVSSWAQSGGSTPGKTRNRASATVSKDTNGQLMGKGVPYNKEKEQFGKQITKKTTGPIPAPSVSSGHDVSDAAQKGLTPGSHVAQREVKMGRKTNPKKGTVTSKKNNQ